MFALFALQFGAALAAAPKKEPPPPPPADADTAEQLYAKLDFEAANSVAERVIKKTGLSHQDLVRVYRVLAITYAVLDKEDQSREAFQQLLAYDPEFTVDTNLGPKVSTPFSEARGYWRALPQKPGIETQVAVRVGEAGTIRVTTRDPSKMVKKVHVGQRWASSGEYQTSTIVVGDGVQVEVPPRPQARPASTTTCRRWTSARTWFSRQAPRTFPRRPSRRPRAMATSPKRRAASLEAPPSGSSPEQS